METIAKILGIIVIAPLMVSCNGPLPRSGPGGEVVENAIYHKESKKGNNVLSYGVDSEMNRSGLITVYYSAECGKADGSSFPSIFDINDSIQVWTSNDESSLRAGPSD